MFFDFQEKISQIVMISDFISFVCKNVKSSPSLLVKLYEFYGIGNNCQVAKSFQKYLKVSCLVKNSSNSPYDMNEQSCH